MDDLLLAQQIISRGSNAKKIFHDSSFMYMTTNEKINLYQHLLKDRNNVLSIIGSGDQVLNTILEGSNNIDAFDISRFPKYLLELKKAGVMALSKDEFIDFFFISDIHKDEYYDDLYFKMNFLLEDKYKIFWDGLFNLYDWSEITRSPLFSSQTVSINTIVDNNIYLNRFNEIKPIVASATINYITDDIYNIALSSTKCYDAINLSSIMYYSNNYRDLLHRLPLTSDGIALTYLYSVNEGIINGYTDCDITTFPNCNEGIMIYQKKN